MTTEHTPGPWVARKTESDDEWFIGNATASAPLFYFVGTCQLERDAHLIAAAPELLAACEELVQMWGEDDVSDAAYEKALAAIAKAKGNC